MKRIGQGLVIALLALLVALAVNLLRLGTGQPQLAVATPAPRAVDDRAVAERLAGALRIRTIAHDVDTPTDVEAFRAMASYLEAQFPRVHAALEREVVGDGSLLYRWPGTDPAAAPVLWLAHLDVVAIEPGTEARWTHAPFSGAIADGYIWGRGALDDKTSALAQLEAVEHLLAEGYVPRRTLWMAFGHDEEIGGAHGAKVMAALLQQRGVRAAMLLDEGGAITQGVVAGVARPVASIMSAEKGYASFRLTARGEGGHSSMPPPQTAVGRLARAVARVQDAPLPARLTPPVEQMLLRLAPEMPFANRLLIANRWLFEPLLLRAMGGLPVTNASIRTTTAPTMLRAGIKDNVLPTEAQAVVNFRLLPGDSVADVEAHLHRVIDDDGIELAVLEGFGNEASRVSPTDNMAFAALERTTREVFPEVLVATGLVTGATDARHYDAVAESRYNFLPVLLQREDLARVHGTDERVSVAGYADAVRWYARLLENLNAAE
jgi:carboxypeptidase PM20D1